MISEERERITSEEYADFLVQYSGDPSLLERFQDATVNTINFFYAVVHVPVSQVTDNIIVKRGYSALPRLYGLISQASLEASGISRLRNISNFNLRGQGVLIGIIDTGIDYTNPVFQYADGTTRITTIWDQTIQSENYPEFAGYGTVYTREQINEALQSANPLGIVPTMDEVGHGTMVAGIAAGSEIPDRGFYGVAPEAEIAVVKLKPAKQFLKDFFRVPQDVLCYQGNDIMFAADYLVEFAKQVNRPIAISIAIGTSQGPHDGRTFLGSYLSLRSEDIGVAVIIAAGNEGNARRHYFGIVDRNRGYDEVELNIGENEQGFSMELWGASPNTYSIDILSPSGEYVPRITARLVESREVSFIFERTIIYIDFVMVEAQSGDQLILVRFSDPDPGIWRFRVYGRGYLELSFHIWLPMSGFVSEDTFFIRSDPYTTILSPGNTQTPITITAYNQEDDSLYQQASRGYTRTLNIKPDLAAPGVGILSPSLNHDFTEVTGTSASAAHTTGVAAMLLEWGIVNGNYSNMNTLEMKMFMIRGARRDVDLIYPNQDWGYGILDVYSVFDRIRGELA